jgi:molecular chaperone DnaJ
VMLKVPAGTQSGKVFRLDDKGVPHLRSRGRGDHLVTVNVVTPTHLSRKQKELLEELARGE